MAPVGLTVAGMAIQQCAYIFRELGAGRAFTFEPEKWNTKTLLVWEAFVSGEAKTDTHTGDARIAAQFFQANFLRREELQSVSAETPVSLVKAAALWGGWTQSGRGEECLVFRP